MALIASISGIRGTIGGIPGDNLTPIDLIKYASAYGLWLKKTHPEKLRVVVGRDARLSGEFVEGLVINSLALLGVEVINLGLSTTPTVEVAVPQFKAQGGIIITASHNPKQWNALKLLNERGEFLNAEQGLKVLKLAENSDWFSYAPIESIGSVIAPSGDVIDWHIDQVLALPLVNAKAIADAKFNFVVDAVNSTGGLAVPKLLKRLGVAFIPIHCNPDGHFPHNPEPLTEHLTDLRSRVVSESASGGIAVDPDVDRLVFICENGDSFGEEYTCVACADYVLSKTPGPTVSNLSSSRALRDVSRRYGQPYYASAVGEVNVVEEMKRQKAVIGGEGNGGVIYPELHYGRDALVGIALFLSLAAEKKCSLSRLRQAYPDYFMSKKKLNLTPGINAQSKLQQVIKAFPNEQISTIDGVKIDFENSWAHVRTSNTEPIIRIYTEAPSQAEADSLADKIIDILQ